MAVYGATEQVSIPRRDFQYFPVPDGPREQLMDYGFNP